VFSIKGSYSSDPITVIDGTDAFSGTPGSPCVTVSFQQSTHMFTVDEFKSLYFHAFSREVSPILNKAFSGLLKSRDFLGYQLDLALGNISEDIFCEIKERYLIPKEKYSEQELLRSVGVLFALTSHVFDSDTIEEMFNCELDEAEKALESWSSGTGMVEIACSY